MNIRTVTLIGTLGLLGIIGLVFRLGPWRTGPAVEVVPVEIGSIRAYLEEQGKTRLSRTHLISMPYEGRILAIDLEEGDPVKAGMVVAQVAPTDLEHRLEEATAAVARLDAALEEQRNHAVEESVIEQVEEYLHAIASTVAAAEQQVKAGQAQLDFANGILQRRQALARREVATTEDLDRATSDQTRAAASYQQDVLQSSSIKSMQAAVSMTPMIVRQYIDRKAQHAMVMEAERREAQARLDRIKLEIKRGTMTSPVDGVVLRREIASEQLLGPGALLLEIGDLATLEIEADVLSEDAVQIESATPVEVFGPAIGQVPVPGRVRRVQPAGFTKVSSLGVEQQRVRVIVEIDSDHSEALRRERGLSVGYRVRVRILTDEAEDALIVPRPSLFRDPEGNWQLCVVRDGFVRQLSVEVGLMNDRRAQIIEGIERDDLVIPAPGDDLNDGDRVQAILPGSDSSETPRSRATQPDQGTTALGLLKPITVAVAVS